MVKKISGADLFRKRLDTQATNSLETKPAGLGLRPQAASLTGDKLKDIIGLESEDNMTTVTRRNRFNGESVELTAAEADKHDKIFYHEAMATLEDQKLGTGASKHWQEMRKLLDWFMKNNAKAYMVLLD